MSQAGLLMQSSKPEPMVDPRDRMRVELASAIVARTHAERGAAAAREALAVARNALWKAKCAAGAARKALEETPFDDIGRRGELQRLEAVAAEAVRVAKAELADCEEEIEPTHGALSSAQACAERAARAVLASSAGGLLEEIETARERFISKLAALTVVEDCINPFPPGETLLKVRGALARAQHDDHRALARRHPEFEVWRTALAALSTDPTANPASLRRM